MARSVDEIQKAIITDVASQPELVTLTNNTSRRAIWRLWTWVTASAIALLEQLLDIFKTEVETTVSLSAPQTAQWVQDKVLKFQYSATDPQVVQLIDLVPQYPVVNADLRIVSRCSVKSNINNAVLIKVAKNNPPEALASGELSALQSYVDIIGVAGINYIVSSTASDKIYIDATIYYNGMYTVGISDAVISAIDNYLATIPFDGVVKLLDLEFAIRSVTGVNDVVLNNVKARNDATPLSSATYLVQNETLVGRLWATVSGYIVGETTSGNTLTDTLTFISE
jgi:hypothetical protein